MRRIIPLNKGFLATEAVYSVYCAQSIPVAVIYIVMDCAQPSRLPFALFNGLLLPAVVDDLNPPALIFTQYRILFSTQIGYEVKHYIRSHFPFFFPRRSPATAGSAWQAEIAGLMGIY